MNDEVSCLRSSLVRGQATRAQRVVNLTRRTQRLQPTGLPLADVRQDRSQNDIVGVRFQQVTERLQAPGVERNLADVVKMVGEAIREIDMSTREHTEEWRPFGR